MGTQSRNADEILARLAQKAHGNVSRAEMLRSGISKREIWSRLQKGTLIRQYPGVYRVGHAAPSADASFMAAVKACGNDAALGGCAGAYLLELIKGRVPKPEVYAPTERRVKGIKTHRGRRATTKVRGIPVTTPAETLVDLAAVLPAEALARACHEAGVKYRTTPRQVEAVLKRRPTAPGAKKLRAILGGDTPVTLSEMERLALAGVREAGLPPPQANRVASARRVDLRWPGRLTVELTSYQFHNSRHSWERDHERRREARARDEEFRTYTWVDVTEQRDEMIVE